MQEANLSIPSQMYTLIYVLWGIEKGQSAKKNKVR